MEVHKQLLKNTKRTWGAPTISGQDRDTLQLLASYFSAFLGGSVRIVVLPAPEANMKMCPLLLMKPPICEMIRAFAECTLFCVSPVRRIGCYLQEFKPSYYATKNLWLVPKQHTQDEQAGAISEYRVEGWYQQ